MHNKETEIFFRNWNWNSPRIAKSLETEMSHSGQLSSKTSQMLTDFIWRRSCTWTLLSARKMKMSRRLAFLYDSFSVISAQMNLLWLQGHYAISCFTMCTMLFENAYKMAWPFHFIQLSLTAATSCCWIQLSFIQTEKGLSPIHRNENYLLLQKSAGCQIFHWSS